MGGIKSQSVAELSYSVCVLKLVVVGIISAVPIYIVRTLDAVHGDEVRGFSTASFWS